MGDDSKKKDGNTPGKRPEIEIVVKEFKKPKEESGLQNRPGHLDV
jgi:hypothetical protein